MTEARAQASGGPGSGAGSGPGGGAGGGAGSGPGGGAGSAPGRAALLERAGAYRLAAELFANEADAELLALASTVPALAPHATPRAAARYTHVFVLNAYPFASVYLDADGGIEGEHAGFTRGVLEALGLRVETGIAADHIAVQLDALAALLEREADAAGANGAADAADSTNTATDRAAARARHAQRVLLAEHLLPWAPLFLDAVVRVDEGLYRATAELIRDTLATHAGTLFGRASLPPPVPSPIEGAPDRGAGAAPGSGPRGVAGSVIDGVADGVADSVADGVGGAATGEGETPPSTVERLSVPARSGLFLSRVDLARLGGSLGLPLRFGGRRFMLEGLAQAAVQQGVSDALTGALAGFAEERRRQLESWTHDLPDLEPLWRPWLERLDATLAALDAPSKIGRERAPKVARPVGTRG